MKFFMFATCLASLSLFADDTSKELKIEEVKSKMISHLDQRIEHINKTKSCVSSATTKDAIKTCREQMREEGKAMKDAWKSRKANN
jgi:hypothetical protein